LGKSKKRVRKENYAEKLKALLGEFKNLLICSVDNVGSHQMQKVRLALRGKAVLLMGKNTVIRKILRQEAEKNPKLEGLLELIVGNVGFVFTNGDLNEIRKTIQSNKVPAAAKTGTLAPEDVFIQPGPTGLDPGQTGFFQALQIPTKIARGSIEIINKVHLIKNGEKVTQSHVALLQKLNIRPFSYGIIVTHAGEDGQLYDARLLDLSHNVLLEKFLRGLRHVAYISLALHIPTTASVGPLIMRAYRDVKAITAELDIKEEKKEEKEGDKEKDEAGDKEKDEDKEDGDKEKEEEDGDKEKEEDGDKEKEEEEEEDKEEEEGDKEEEEGDKEEEEE